MSWSLVQTCGLLSLLCGAWNLFGDLYYLDFYKAHMSDDEFAMIRSADSFRPGNIFYFDENSHFNSLWLYLAQAGGWMYPVWAVATTLPLYIGLIDAGFWCSIAPCTLLAYGLCVIGGSLHSAFAFLTVLPNVFHHHVPEAVNGWGQMADSSVFANFLETSQSMVIQHIVVGCLPGYLAVNIGTAWITYIVATKSNQIKFPKWFNLFNPFVTMFWISIIGFLLPDPWGFYLVGSLGTWGVLFFNIAITFVLWNKEEELLSHSVLVGSKQE